MGDGREGRWTSVGLFLEEKGSGLYNGHANAFTAGKKIFKFYT